MPKATETPLSLLHFIRFTDQFVNVDWSASYENPFPVTQILQTIQAEAQAKGAQVVLQVALVPNPAFFETLTNGELDDGQPE